MLWYVTLYVTMSVVAGEGQKTGSSESVGCFVCHSYNNSDPGCSDPFNPGYSVYTPKCKQGVEGRVGMFPAHFCIKMSGVSIDGGIELNVRTCALKSMHDQCGTFEFADILYHGCVTTCDKNGCNQGSQLVSPPSWIKLTLTTYLSLAATVVLSRYEKMLIR